MGWFLADLLAHEVIFETKVYTNLYYKSKFFKSIYNAFSTKNLERQIYHFTGLPSPISCARNISQVFMVLGIYNFGLQIPNRRNRRNRKGIDVKGMMENLTKRINIGP